MGDHGGGGGGGEPPFHETLSVRKSLSSLDSEVFSLRYSPDGETLLACAGDGKVHLRGGVGEDPGGKDRVLEYEDGGDGRCDFTLPSTCACFRPACPSKNFTAGVCAVTYSDGKIRHWHVPSRKLLGTTSLCKKNGSILGVEALCVAYPEADPSEFAVGASDGLIRLYDEETKKVTCHLQPGVGVGTHGGHSNRVYSIKYCADDDSTIVSGGADKCIQVWDARTGCSVRTMFGPMICGDSMDISRDQIVTGACQTHDQLQLWDMGTGKPIVSPVKWSSSSSERACKVYAACYSHGEEDGAYIAAGGGDGSNEAKVFLNATRRPSPLAPEDGSALIGSLLGLRSAVMSLCFSPSGNDLAVGLGSGEIHILRISKAKGAAAGEKVIML